jgi:membrane protein
VVGALLSAVLFEAAKTGFVAYVSNANYSVIYGALATVPIFLFWLYIVWIVVLFGASLAASLTTFSERVNLGDWPDKWAFQLVYRLVGHLWNAQCQGSSVSTMELLELEERASERQVQALMQQLLQSHIVTRNQDDRWVLSRDLGAVSLGELYHCGNYYLPLAEEADLPLDSEWDQAFVRSLAMVHDKGEAVLTRPLRGMYLENVQQDTR